MARRKKSALTQLRRDLYLAQRTIGDGQAAAKGPKPLATRLARRQERRFVWRLLRKLGL